MNYELHKYVILPREMLPTYSSINPLLIIIQEFVIQPYEAL